MNYIEKFCLGCLRKYPIMLMRKNYCNVCSKKAKNPNMTLN